MRKATRVRAPIAVGVEPAPVARTETVAITGPAVMAHAAESAQFMAPGPCTFLQPDSLSAQGVGFGCWSGSACDAAPDISLMLVVTAASWLVIGNMAMPAAAIPWSGITRIASQSSALRRDEDMPEL